MRNKLKNQARSAVIGSAVAAKETMEMLRGFKGVTEDMAAPLQAGPTTPMTGG